MTTLDDMFLLVKEIRDVLVDGLEERQAVEVARSDAEQSFDDGTPGRVVTLPVKAVSVNVGPYMFDPDPDEPLTPTWYQREYEREVARRENMARDRDNFANQLNTMTIERDAMAEMATMNANVILATQLRLDTTMTTIDKLQSERDQWQREAERVRLELRKCRQEA